MATKKPTTDPRLTLVDFVKPDGTSVRVNSFPASLDAAIAAGWLPEKEFKAAAKAEAAKAAAAKKK